MFIGHTKKFNQMKVMYLYKGKKKLEHILFNTVLRGGVKMAEEQDGEITFSPTNSSKEQLKGEQSLQNNF